MRKRCGLHGHRQQGNKGQPSNKTFHDALLCERWDPVTLPLDADAFKENLVRTQVYLMGGTGSSAFPSSITNVCSTEYQGGWTSG